MIDAETIKALILTVLIAVIATILRRRAGFMIVLWAFALGFFIAAKIIKMQAMRHLNETMVQMTLMQDEMNQELQTEIPLKPDWDEFINDELTQPLDKEMAQREFEDWAAQEGEEDEPIDEWDDYGGEE
jgi:predicted PurR-regulated permease PerM